MKNIAKILVVTISSLSITGVSFFDGQIWNRIFRIVGIISYGFVGLFISTGLLVTKKASSSAYALTYTVLIIVGFKIYEWLMDFKLWISSWPLFVKISLAILVITALVVYVICLLKPKKEVNSK